MSELITVEKANIAALFTGQGVDELLAEIERVATAQVPDLTTKKSRSAVGGMARKVSSSKAYLDNLGKELVADKKAEIKAVDGVRRKIRDTLDELRDKVRAPLTEWEAAEKARIAGYEELLEWLGKLAVEYCYPDGAPLNAAGYQASIDKLDAFDVGQDFEEFTDQVLQAYDKAQRNLAERHAEAERREAEQAELERLRKEAAEREQKERDERIAREAAEKAKAEAEAAAKAERERAEQEKRQAIEAQLEAERQAELAKQQAEQEAKAAAERAEREKQQAIEAERQRQAAEVERQRQEQAAREADKEHRRQINSEALAGLMAACALDHEYAKQVITAIAKGAIPHVTINY